MKHGRYTHTSTILNEYVYVLGGRYFGCGESGVLFHCERFNLDTKHWEDMPPLHTRRCTAVATSYKNHVYIIGGYKGEGRCKSIERFDERRKCWDIIPLMLLYPIEASVLLHVTSNEVVLLGGKDQYLEQAYVTLYDLERNVWNI